MKSIRERFTSRKSKPSPALARKLLSYRAVADKTMFDRKRDELLRIANPVQRRAKLVQLNEYADGYAQLVRANLSQFDRAILGRLWQA